MKLTDGDRIFKDALLRGSGRCFAMLATESARRKLRPLVVWACGCNLGYDTQVEGTRALFLYDLIGQYPRPEPFLDIVEKKVLAIEKRFFSSANKSVLESLFVQECDLLTMFAYDGNMWARRVLDRCYERFLRHLLNMERTSNPDGLVLDSFAYLCGRLLVCAGSMEAQSMLERIVRDVGRLRMKDGACYSGFVDYFRCEAENTLGERRYAAMLGRMKAIPEVEAYKAAVFQAKKADEAEIAEWKRRLSLGYKEVYRRIKKQDIAGVRGIVGSWWRNGRTKDIEGLVKLYDKEEEHSTKARILDMFRAPKLKGYLPVDSVLRDASSEDDGLRAAALYALDGIKDQRVRDFAFDELEKRGMSCEIASLIASNYRESDDDLLIAALKKHGEMCRHHLGIGVLDNAGGKGCRLSKRIITYLYDTTRCSFCRERAVRELGRRGFLTREMATECLHDANDDIRDYAKRFLSRRRAKAIPNHVNPVNPV